MTRLRQVLPFLLIPVSIIVGANLVGLALRFLIPFLDRSSRLLPQFWDEYWLIFIAIGVFPLAGRLVVGALSQPILVRYPEARYEEGCGGRERELRRPARRKSLRGLLTVLMLLCVLPGSGGGPEGELPSPARRKFSFLRFFAQLVLLCIGLCFLLVLCIFVYDGLKWLFATHCFRKYNLLFFQVLVLAFFQFVLRTHALQSMTWKKLGDLWTKAPTISAISVGGFGFIATSDAVKNPLLRLTLESDYTNLSLIVPTALFGVLTTLLAMILERVGRTKSPDDGGNIPRSWFYTAFGLAFVANVAMFGLLLNSVFLTVYTHFATQVLNGT